MLKQLIQAVKTRFAIGLLLEKTLFRKVSKTPWYQGDGATLMILLSVQLITGAILTLHYSNSIDLAYQSVEHITEFVVMGWFTRGLHYWSAGLMMVMLIFHLFRLLMVGGYKAPREGTWIIGVFLFFLVIIMSFSGYVLRWDERAVYAVKILLNILSKFPLIGEHLVVFVQGGSEINAQTLIRFYSVHVFLAPGLLILLAGYHLYLVIVYGPTSRVEGEVLVSSASQQKALYQKVKKSKTEGEDFFPTTVTTSGTMGFLVFLLAVILTLTLGPAPLYPEANLTTDSFPKEEWWFWWYSALIAILPPKAVAYFVIWFPILLFLILIIIPLIDRGSNRGISNRPFWSITVGLATLALLGLSAYRLRSPWTGWPSSALPDFPSERIITPGLIEGRKLFVSFGCNSCHAVADQGPKVGPDITEFQGSLTRSHIKNYILSPPKGVAMPGYAGRMKEEELKYVTEFVFVMQTQPRRNGK